MKVLQSIALAFLLTIGLPVSARTVNPADLIIDGGYSLYVGASETTQLFVDRADDGQRAAFWVRVVVNPGTLVEPMPGQPPKQEPTKVYIKHFPLSRYFAVLKELRKIGTFGVVNPYLDGAVICDGPNSTIRVGGKKVIMAYNCGSGGPDADAATFAAEALLKALRTETLQDAELQGELPLSKGLFPL